ncbi:MAG: hypothetical protein ABL996_00520 [Micropepsaceae bacterium]
MSVSFASHPKSQTAPSLRRAAYVSTSRPRRSHSRLHRSSIDDAHCCGIVTEMNKIVRKFEVSKSVDAAIDRIVKDTSRTPSQIVADAIERLQSDYDDLSIEAERWAEYERTGEAIDLEDVRKRLNAQVRAHRSKTARSKKK